MTTPPAPTSRGGTRAVVAATSAAERAQLLRILHADGAIVVVGQTDSGDGAVHLTSDLRPDIVVVDLSLAAGGAVLAIQQIMARVPTPILGLSRHPQDPLSSAVVDALAAGALEVVPVPERWTAALETRLCRSVRLLRGVPVMRHGARTTGPATRAGRTDDRHVVAVGASTGGPSALATVLAHLQGLTAPVLVVQHLHADFTAGLVDWMARVSVLPVELAEHGVAPRPGHVYIAPGGTHLRLTAGWRLELSEDPETLHRPSVDELFRSVAEHAGTGATGVLLTGMGDDGARGLLAIRERGGRTLAQDEESCAVFGMPAAAERLGAVTELLAPLALARAVSAADRTRRR